MKYVRACWAGGHNILTNQNWILPTSFIWQTYANDNFHRLLFKVNHSIFIIDLVILKV